ncbi:MAG: hypothetical protein H7Y09_04545 [Chitinophagaceae bacterium]|nr:hypothetical protein [Anaerolineae bacterium]
MLTNDTKPMSPMKVQGIKKQPCDSRTTKKTKEPRQAVCPSCGHYAEFVHIGDQHWPARVAAAAGIPEVMALWNCIVCESTLSEIDLFR